MIKNQERMQQKEETDHHRHYLYRLLGIFKLTTTKIIPTKNEIVPITPTSSSIALFVTMTQQQ